MSGIESDEDWESENEAEAVAVAEITALSDSDTDQSSVYSYDVDAEYDEQVQPSNKEVYVAEGDGVRPLESSSTFPSLSSIKLTFLFETPDCVSVASPLEGCATRFRMTPLRRTGEVELQIEMEAGVSSKDIEIGLERCAHKIHIIYEFLHSIDPLRESSCTFSLCGAVFNCLKRNASVDISYSQDKFSLSQGVSRIGLKITRGGDLEFFMNGQSLGIAAQAIYKLGRNTVHHPTTFYYPILWLPLGNNKATLIAGGNTPKY